MTLIITAELAEQRLKALGITPNAIHTRSTVENNPYAKKTQHSRAYLWTATWTPEELRAIADHMEAICQR